MKVQPKVSVLMEVYSPSSAAVTGLTLILGVFAEKLLGPVHDAEVSPTFDKLKLSEPLGQIAESPTMLCFGTITTTESISVQPLALTVTRYLVELLGEALGVKLVVELSPKLGDQSTCGVICEPVAVALSVRVSGLPKQLKIVSALLILAVNVPPPMV